jgi:hypothetical protein
MAHAVSIPFKFKDSLISLLSVLYNLRISNFSASIGFVSKQLGPPNKNNSTVIDETGTLTGK